MALACCRPARSHAEPQVSMPVTLMQLKIAEGDDDDSEEEDDGEWEQKFEDGAVQRFD